ncbi:MAG: Bax inhibitor-1 family protein [Myxococcota bacterium]
MQDGHALDPHNLNPVPSIDSREQFISRTYSHLFGAVLAFIGLEAALFASGLGEPLAQVMLQGSWLIVLGAFIVVGWIASRVAHTVESLSMQYVALAGYVVAEVLIFVPMIYLAETMAPGALEAAGIATIVGFSALTAIAFVTRKDFSFMKGFLMWAGVGALALIVVNVAFGMALGPLFAVGMVLLAGASILYDTSNVIHHYEEDRYVAASLELFASVALMFWYVLRIAIVLMAED